MRTLYQFPLSNYCEKARWLLDHKELDYVARNLIPGVHRLLTRWYTSGDTLPMLHDGKVWVDDSTEIALYLDGAYSEKPLISRDPELRTQIIGLDELGNELGDHVRRWMLAYSLDNPHTMDIVVGEQGLMHTFGLLSKPILKKGMKILYQIKPEPVAASRRRIDDLINEIETILLEDAEDGETTYLVGNEFSLADIAVCAAAAPIFGIEGTPWVVPQGEVVPEPVALYRDELLARPFGQYVMRVFAQDRKAKVDWRGQ